jgi:DUF4097 and DUF4098 domain-containing protein YvlB
MSRIPLCQSPLIKAAVFGIVLVLFAWPSVGRADDWKYEETHREARDFVTGGSVHVHATVGDVHIRRGTSNQIRLEYTVKSRRESNVKKAIVDFDVHGSEANISFHAPTGGNTEFEVDLEVPPSTNLDVHEKVGDMTVENIEGDKDLELGVGDIRLANGASGYRVVHASTGIGDVNGADYGEASGWLGKTLKYHGEGKYELRAHVGVGDIHLEGK